jgi:hypothetical protein
MTVICRVAWRVFAHLCLRFQGNDYWVMCPHACRSLFRSRTFASLLVLFRSSPSLLSTSTLVLAYRAHKRHTKLVRYLDGTSHDARTLNGCILLL